MKLNQIGVGLYLVQQTQIFQPKAAESVPADLRLPPSEINILELKYFPPSTEDEDFLNPDITGIENTSIAQTQEYVNYLSKAAINSLTKATSYHGYKTANSPYLNFKVIESQEYFEAIPKADRPIRQAVLEYRPDYRKILTDHNICDLVDNQGVSQVWIWSYHHGDIEPDESNMSMGKASKKFWNYSSYGDVSNSEQSDNLPTCSKTYTLYNYNYDRGLEEILEDHGHQLEQLFTFVDKKWFNAFINNHGDKREYNSCGWTHSPPNTTNKQQYYWDSWTEVQSYCEDWKAEGIVKLKTVSCHTWYGPECKNNGGVEFKIWWMQNIPGYENTITYRSHPVRNWWQFYGDFDKALEIGKSFYLESIEIPFENNPRIF